MTRIPDPLMDRALAAWREANPQGLIGRLVELHQRDPERARWLARHIERYYAQRTPPGEHWPYQWLMVDVAAWPVVRGPSRLRVFYQDMPSDQTLCLVCGGYGRVEPRDIGESLADALEKYPELGIEGVLEEISCPTCRGTGEVPVQPPVCPSCSGSGRWDDDIPCGRCGGEGVLR